MDKLDLLLNKQKELQTTLGVYKEINTPSAKQQYINQNILAIFEETVEVMRESAYKNPKYVSFGWKINQESNPENFKKELIDLLHFVLNLFIISEMDSDEIVKQFLNKHNVNKKRIQYHY